jgi:hypothetical protein
MSNGKFRLLESFRTTFAGRVYKHRNSTVGNKIARELFEDLFIHSVSAKYAVHLNQGIVAVNRGGGVHGRVIRRNDSVFGRIPAAAKSSNLQGYAVPEGPIADARIGCEVKIVAKAQLKQIDRVVSDLDNFLSRVRQISQNCINVAIVGVNHEPDYVGYEGRRRFKGKLSKGETATVILRLGQLSGRYDELLILPFEATNQRPFPFMWLNAHGVDLDYGAALARIGQVYDQRF